MTQKTRKRNGGYYRLKICQYCKTEIDPPDAFYVVDDTVCNKCGCDLKENRVVRGIGRRVYTETQSGLFFKSWKTASWIVEFKEGEA